MTETRDFWSRRKAAVQAEAEAEEVALQVAETERAQAELAEKSDEDILAELDLPDPDTLKMGDDVTGFMQDVVPARLRHRALRRLWRLNPVLANVDGLVDYGEDYTDAACVIENLQTAYQVGKGMLTHVQTLAEQAEQKDAEETEQPDDALKMAELAEDDTPPVTQDMTSEPAPEAAPAAEPGKEAATPGGSDAPALSDPEPPIRPPAPRRMTFEFEG